jgi:membrane-bound serine protease (ClpP class)
MTQACNRERRAGIGGLRRLLFVALAAAGLAGATAQGQTPAANPVRDITASPTAKMASNAPAGTEALLVDINGAIGPASLRHLTQALQQAQRDQRIALIILRIDTPGGLVTSMREMIAGIIASRVPVIGYVAPSGARAASAGTYILYATNVAAMAPGTNVGAATPIEIGAPAQPGLLPGKREPGKGEPPADAGKAKAINDMVAFIRSLAELRGRNVKWAEEAVRQASSISASEALKFGVIDLIADDVPGLLTALDGRKVKIGKDEQTLATKGLTVRTMSPDTLTQLLSVITDPNIALILMMIGIYGIIFEFFTPGSFAPGVIGAISLVLGLYALNQLPFNFAGLALLLIGIVCMIGEVFTPTFGALAIGGLVAFVLGATFLFDTDVPGFKLSWTVISAMAATSALMLTLLLGYVWRAMRRPVSTGEMTLVGRTATVVDWSGASGHVFAHGERWSARSQDKLDKGQSVRILRLDGLTLIVSGGAT